MSWSYQPRPDIAFRSFQQDAEARALEAMHETNLGRVYALFASTAPAVAANLVINPARLRDHEGGINVPDDRHHQLLTAMTMGRLGVVTESRRELPVSVGLAVVYDAQLKVDEQAPLDYLLVETHRTVASGAGRLTLHAWRTANPDISTTVLDTLRLNDT